MAEQHAGDVLPASLAVDKLTMEKALCPELAPSRLAFPTEFPFEFNSPTLSSAFTSPADSTETEDESSDDEEDFLAGLTRRLALSTQRIPPLPFSDHKAEEKPHFVSTSPQSTLSGLGSWSASGSGSPNGPSSQVPSPPTTSFREDDTWDVISAAAGQVARLKMVGAREALLSRPNSNPNPLFHRHAAHHDKPQDTAFCSNPRLQQVHSFSNQSTQVLREECESTQQCYADWVWHPKNSCYQSHLIFKSPEQQIPSKVTCVMGCDNVRCVRPATWQQQQQQVFPVGSAGKRSSSGTGVFLPRRYPNPSESSRKKSGYSSGVFHSRVVHPQNLNFDEFNYISQPNSRPCLSSGYIQLDYDTLMARREGLLTRQGGARPVPGGCLNQERPLPRQWML